MKEPLIKDIKTDFIDIPHNGTITRMQGKCTITYFLDDDRRAWLFKIREWWIDKMSQQSPNYQDDMRLESMNRVIRENEYTDSDVSLLRIMRDWYVRSIKQNK